ncbi:MAG: ribonuclease [Bacteroidia bacterium]|nr:MAG: ribonuclease [Bacteroidia bacterium]
MKKEKKIFVLDTNVILHDFRSIYSFEENDIVVPIVVLEELDQFKKGSSLINFQAREFMRELDKISGRKLFTEGISLGADKGLLFIETGKPFSEKMKQSFSERTPDHRILAIAEHVANKFEYREAVLVTQDINLRMKAKSLGLKAQDYETGKVDVSKFDRKMKVYQDIDAGCIKRLYDTREGIPYKDCNLPENPIANDYFILRSGNASVLARYNKERDVLLRVEKRRTYGITPRNAEQTFSIDALMNKDICLISLTGKAGTGKTLMALAAALEQKNDFEKIYLARPIVPLSNRDLGFLPGDVKDKIGPYMQPLFDNLSVIKHQFSVTSKEYVKIEDMLKTEKLNITPLAYIRGRSLSNSFFIVDEAQNLTPHEIKTIITRAGENTKMVFTGDIQQIDSPYLDAKSNGLSYLSDKMQGQEIFAHVNLVKGERSYLAELASDLL